MIIQAVVVVDLLGQMKFRWWLAIHAMISLVVSGYIPIESGQVNYIVGTIAAFVLGLAFLLPVWLFFKLLSWVIRSILGNDYLDRYNNNVAREEYSSTPQRVSQKNTRTNPTYAVYRRPKGGYDMKVADFTNPQGAIACGESYKKRYPNDFIRVSSSDGGTMWTS